MHRISRMITVAVLTGFIAGLTGFGQQETEPDYTRGEKLEGHSWGNLNYANLGSTGATGWIWAQGLSTANTRMIQIKEVAEGSPADGVLQEGDVLRGVIFPDISPMSSGGRFDFDVRFPALFCRQGGYPLWRS